MKIIKNLCITLAYLGVATVLCLILSPLASTDTHVPLIYVLAVLCISRFTSGYIYGVLASIVAVAGVNYIFTYPYFQMNFSITGYPLTFFVMLAVALFVSALTTQIKHQEQMRLDVEKEKVRSNLLRAISHDIRTPLTSIAGAAAGIIDNKDKLSEEQKVELLTNIKEESEWMIRMVENLLSITRITDDKTQLSTVDELVEDVIGSAVVKFSRRFPKPDISVDIPSEMLLVPMDSILIEQVLINLMENAMIHGVTTTKLHLTVTTADDNAIFSVEDNGRGIDEHLLPDIFQGMLNTQSGHSSDNKRNMGMGLSVCQAIITAHNGTMKAENIPDGGAKISFTLPLGKDKTYEY